MAKSEDFICDVCGEFVSLQDNGMEMMIYAEQPGDRIGTTYDMAKLHPFMAYLSGMRIPRLAICELCLFHGTKATDGTRTLPPIMTVDVTHPQLLNYFERHGASLTHPGLTQAQAAKLEADEAKAKAKEKAS